MWYLLSDENKYVYHYTRATTLVEKILPRQQLRFSRFENLNDPREAKDWEFGYVTYSNGNFEKTTDIGIAANEIIKRNCRVGCFVSDVYEATISGAKDDPISPIYERGHSRPRMWAQYADNHSGVCLVFEKDKLDQNIRTAAKYLDATVTSGRVEYANSEALRKSNFIDPLILELDKIERFGLEIAVEKHTKFHLNDLFFLKSKDWSQEREMRWVIHDNGAEDFFVPFKGALVGMALGDKIEERHRPAIGKYCLENDLDIVDMRWRNGLPQPRPTHANLQARWGGEAATR